MKKYIYEAVLFIHHFLLYFSCYFNLPKFCAYLIKISFFQPKLFRNKSKSKKITIILDRMVGARRDLEIIQKNSNNLPQLVFMRRKLVKLVFFAFSNKKRLIFNYSKLVHPNRFNYFDLEVNNRKQLEKFWTSVIFYLKESYKDNTLNFITFAYFYSTEYPLYIGCKNNNISVKLWNKESFNSEPDLLYRSKSKQFKRVCQYFQKIAVYNKPMQKMFIQMDKNNRKKVAIMGYPKSFDFTNQKKKLKKIKNILFLSFDTKLGFPMAKKYEKLNFNTTYDKVIKILNELSNEKKFNICIKRKSINPTLYKTKIKIDKSIKIIEKGTATKYTNKADIVIGLNSSSTLEAIINGKYVIVPFFERKIWLKKYLYKFHKDIIYNSEKKMKSKILSLFNKQVSFPIINKKNQKTINYYFGSFKNIKENYIKFLNS